MPPWWEMLLTHSSHVSTEYIHRWTVDLRIDFILDMGQGGAMAIEDAVSIATLLPLGTSCDKIPTRLDMYQSLRRPRVDLVLEYTRRNGEDDNDRTSARITRRFLLHFRTALWLLNNLATEMVKFMGTCFSYNEIESSNKMLQIH